MTSSSDLQFTELKDTISQLNNTIRNQNLLIESLQKMLEERNAKDDAKDRIIADLEAQLAYLKQKLFGSTSESRKVEFEGQIGLFDDLVEKPVVTIEPECIEVKSYTKQKKAKPTYDEMFNNLPVEQRIVNTLSDEDKICGICGTTMPPIGHEVIRTEIKYTPAKLTRVEYLATTYGCPVCKDTEEPQFIKDNGQPALIPGSYASSGLAAHVMYAKYVMALPLYRQEKDFENLGAKISRGAMAHWIIYCSENYLKPVYDHMHKQLLKRRFFMADETPVQVLKEPDRRAQSKSYVWLIRSGEDGLFPIILYHYSTTRKGQNAADFLKGAEPGYYLMVDGYKGYNKLKAENRCSCYAHIRRYLIQAIPKGHEKDFTEPAVQGVLYCDKLFEYERSYKEKGLSPKQIYNRRLKDQKPVIEAFLSWVDNQTAPKSEQMRKALNYINGCRPYMMTYLKDGHCSLSNNLSENSIRPVVTGRKNWLFSDTQAGADASMVVYSMIETAKANGIDQEAYLNYLLDSRPNVDMTEEQLDQLMPWSDEVKIHCSKKE